MRLGVDLKQTINTHTHTHTYGLHVEILKIVLSLIMNIIGEKYTTVQKEIGPSLG